MAVHFSVVEPDGVRVPCDEKNWANHVAAKHLEMRGREAWVRQTIEHPAAIYQSDTHSTRRVFYRAYRFDPPVGQAFLRVVVAYDRNRLTRRTTAAVVTAFAAAGPKRGEALLWPAPTP